MSLPILCIDFDGVLHSYKSGWQGVDVVSDPPNIGAMEWLAQVINHFRCVIWSSRNSKEAGIAAMRSALTRWLLKTVGPEEAVRILGRLSFPTEKPAAFLTVDDRAWCFNGMFPSVEEMQAFKPWYKRDPL